MTKALWTYRPSSPVPWVDPDTAKEYSINQSATIVSPEGHDVLVIERVRRPIDIEAKDLCSLLNTTRAHLAEGVVFA